MSSFFEKAKLAALQAADATKKAATAAAEATKKKYAELKAPPSNVKCSGCPLNVEVPASVWDWSCSGGHQNVGSVEVCSVCAVAKPKVENPRVTCATCNAVTVVPNTNFHKDMREAGSNAKNLAVTTAASVKAGVDHLRAAPTTFHCAHCNSLLATPAGVWSCQTCTVDNEEAESKCKQCGQAKTEQKAICGVCRQSTSIPSNNLLDGLKNTHHGLVQSSKKIYYDVSGKPYVTCGRCGCQVRRAGEGGTASLAVASAAPGEAGPAPVGGAPPAAAAPADAVEGSVNEAGRLVCPKCKNEIES